MDFNEIAKGIIVADLYKAGATFAVLVFFGVAYAIASWLGK